jgi:putative ABC transport system permease protein
MLELVIANLKTRPFRTLISIIGVSLGVILVVLFTGLARGMTNDMSKRANNWKAEILFTRPGAMDLTSSNLSVSVSYLERLREIEGVDSVTPVGKNFTPDPKTRFGLMQLDGVEWETFSKMNEITLVSGRAPASNSEVFLDEREMRVNNLKLGDSIELFGGKKYEIVGVFSPPSGSRIKMSLAALQDALQTPNKCTYILVKVRDGVNPEVVAQRINEILPGNKINLTRDLVIDAQERLPALNTFLRVLVGLGAFVSTIFVLLSMYTTITERKKEIGILKSLGASTTFIVTVIESEAFLIGVLGVVLGLSLSFLSSSVIQAIYELPFEFSANWIITAVAIAIGGSLFGALYPAWKAAGIDPVEVMVNE